MSAAKHTPGPDYERMFNNAVASLAEVSEAIGVPDDEASVANGNELILERVAAMRAMSQNSLETVVRVLSRALDLLEASDKVRARTCIHDARFIVAKVLDTLGADASALQQQEDQS